MNSKVWADDVPGLPGWQAGLHVLDDEREIDRFSQWNVAESGQRKAAA